MPLRVRLAPPEQVCLPKGRWSGASRRPIRRRLKGFWCQREAPPRMAPCRPGSGHTLLGLAFPLSHQRSKADFTRSASRYTGAVCDI